MFISSVSQISIWMTDSGSRGILTDTDREWLKGEVEYEQRQTAAKRRAQIRDRVTAALHDFALLTEHWSADERNKIFSELDEPDDIAAEMIKFLYIGLNDLAMQSEGVAGENQVDNALAFRRALSEGIESGKANFGRPPGEVLIDSNTKLFELPSVDDLHEDITTEQWRTANEYVQGAFDKTDDSPIDQKEAAQNYHMALHLEIEEKLFNRRQRSNSEIKRHDQLVRRPGFRGDRE
jgi:hypothetical protein